jgi:hypothetical protein
MKPQISEKQFADYVTAFNYMQMKNKAYQRAKNNVDIACVVPGRDGNNYAVVDLKTAIELELGYVFSYDGWTDNPWINQGFQKKQN